MNILKEHKAIEQALATYSAKLETMTDEYFWESPADGGWCFAEVYSHILKATLGASISLEKCTNKNTEKSTKGTSFFGYYVMLVGKFPPIKVKVPTAIAEKMPAEKISREEAKKLIEKCHKRIHTVLPLLTDALPDIRYKHPRLGMLNAQQWFKFIRIHAEHHLAQLARIERKIKKG